MNVRPIRGLLMPEEKPAAEPEGPAVPAKPERGERPTKKKEEAKEEP